METPVVTPIEPKGKVYMERSIWAGTFLGGPLAAGYMMAENYKKFGEKEKIPATWIISVLATIFLFLIGFLMPEDVNIPNMLFPLLSAGTAAIIVWKLQGGKIQTYIQTGGAFYSGWRALLVSIISIVSVLLLVLAAFLLFDPAMNMASKTYGPSQNEIFYVEENVSASEVDRMADCLTKEGFFTADITQVVYLDKINGTFELSIIFEGDASKDEPTVNYLTILQNNVQFRMNKPVAINICAQPDQSNVKLRIKGGEFPMHL